MFNFTDSLEKAFGPHINSLQVGAWTHLMEGRHRQMDHYSPRAPPRAATPCPTQPRPHSLPLIVRQGDALGRHLEVNHRAQGWWLLDQGDAQSLLDGLVACEGLHVHGVEVPHVAGCGRGEADA